MLNKALRGIRACSVRCIRNVGLILLQCSSVSVPSGSSMWGNTTSHHTDLTVDSTSWSVSGDIRSVLLRRITSAQAICLCASLLKLFSDALSVNCYSVTSAWLPSSFALILPSFPLIERTFKIFLQSTTQTTPSRTRSPSSSFSQNPLAIGPLFD